MIATYDEVLEALEPVTKALESMAVPYMICGSIASNVYGIPRLTQDVDLVAAIPLFRADALATTLQGTYYVSPEAIREAIRLRRSFNVIHLKSFVKIDVFVAKDDPFTRIQLERRHPEQLDRTGKATSVATAEDVVLSKLRWYREGGGTSEQQWKDVMGVLKVQAERLDRAYMAHWARELDLKDLLAKAFDDSGLEPLR